MPDPTPQAPRRLASLDAYRGLTMLMMASAALGVPAVAKHFPDSCTWQLLAREASHAEWSGCSVWDLIQPSFMFMVGVALPFSLASRRAKGQSWIRLWGHAVYRAAALVVLGIFLMSNWSEHTEFTFVNVLTQIGLGYLLVFFLAGRSWGMQLGTALAILAGYWYLFYQHPLRPPDFDWATVGVGPDFEKLTGLFAHWSKNVNVAADFDVWFLNLFPRTEPFRFNEGGYQTLNFVPSIATMTFGLLAGELLRGERRAADKLLRLIAAGLGCLAVGYFLGEALCPIVKRIWTPSWAVYSTGWTCLILAAFYGVVDLLGWRWLALPFVVVGMNSIAMYCMRNLMHPWVTRTLKIHLGQNVFAGTFGPMVEEASALFVLWLICLWMYRRKIFLRI